MFVAIRKRGNANKLILLQRMCAFYNISYAMNRDLAI